MIINSKEHLLKVFYDSIGASQVWSSSALNLDNTLRMDGYNITKFFHNYKLPDSKESLEQESNKMLLFSSLEYNISKIEKVFGEKIKMSDSLNLELQQTKTDIFNKIIKLSEEIKIKNPELNNIKTPKVIDMVHFIRGAVFGYPPENIKFWIENYPDDNVFNEALAAKRVLKEKFGIDVGLMRLTKKQAEILLQDVEEQSKNKFLSAKSKINEKQYPVDDVGRYDPTGFLRFMQGRDDDL